MIALPIRKSEIYEEIENFKDYEFTNCIAYEMAIRNKELISIIKQINTTKSIVFNGNKVNLSKVDEVNLKIQNLKEMLLNDYFINYDDIRLKFDILSDFDDFTDENYHTSKRIPFVNIQEKKNNFKVVTFFIFQRPKLITRNKLKKEITLNLNIVLPKDELLAYISKIKDEYDKDNSIIKSPLELLGEDLERSHNKKVNKKLIADKFFIYDYVTVRQEQIKEINEDIIQEYEEYIEEIKNSTFINGKDRKIQLKELKKELNENIINTKVDDIFKDIEDYKPATVKRYYYDMKPFIDNLKYKELITGTIQ